MEFKSDGDGERWNNYVQQFPLRDRITLERILGKAPARAAFTAALLARRDERDEPADGHDRSVSPHLSRSDAELPLITDDARHGELYHKTDPVPDPPEAKPQATIELGEFKRRVQGGCSSVGDQGN